MGSVATKVLAQAATPVLICAEPLKLRGSPALCRRFMGGGAAGQAVEAGAHHPVDDLSSLWLAAGLQEARHRVAGAREDGVQHHLGRQRAGFDRAVGLGLHDPGAELVAQLHQQPSM
jgi:hypothetical protein